MARTGKKAQPIENAYPENRGTRSKLAPELTAQIVGMARNGKINAEIITFLGIPEDTFYTWIERNTYNLKDLIAEARRAHMLDKAEEIGVALLNSKNERIRLEMLKHLTETLGKKWYSKREEHKLLEDDEGTQLEPENKEKLDKLLSPLQSKDLGTQG